MIALYILLGVLVYLWLAHFISYNILKHRIIRSRKWGLNICCGKTDVGRINADVVKHMDVVNFKFIKDIYRLPFKDREFESVLCSHTIEHVDDPHRFYQELQRVGDQVTLVIPPLYDISAVFDIFEHRWIFLSFRKVHHRLPKFIKLPGAHLFQRRFGQVKRA